MPKRQNLISEFIGFIAKRKAYWLIPILIVVLILASLIALAAISPAAAPFIYTLF
jgi:hypothetical protein